MTDEELQKILEENLALTKEIRALTAKTESYIKWLRVSDVLKLLLIILPLIAAWIYLPDIIQSFTAGYGSIIPEGFMIK